ncbi:MAG: radical SAM protein [Candidatus Omnitrophica bacterium]|nr:radical SAM protein [Candidatus Omnitrophota bacterium]
MRIKNKQRLIAIFLKARFLNKRLPLAVRWQLTNRCVLKCKYCNLWSTPQKEFTIDKIISILDEMAVMGTQTISFSGGEPMLREDIAEILEETVKRGISTEMNSTGAGIPGNTFKLKHLDFLKLSLDGPEEIHDAVRGKNSYKMVIEAAKAASNAKVRFIFTTTLTKYNIKETGFLLEEAQRFNTLVAFQPLKSLYRGVEDISFMAPGEQDFKQAIRELIIQKKNGNPHLRNSLVGLNHIYQWPYYPKLKCWAGKIFCILNTDGTLLPCDRIAYNSGLPDCRELGFERAFSMLPETHCSGCGFCGVLELNFIMSLKFGTIKSIYNILR